MKQRIPSLKTMRLAFKAPEENLRLLRRILRADGNELLNLVAEHCPATYAWARGCYACSPFEEVKLEAANEMLEGFGTESITPKGAKPPIDCVNMGDPYVDTLMLIGGNWRVGAWMGRRIK